jgi:uncharacterized protein
MSRNLVLFVRNPRLGRGKRRLARDIGDVAAVRFERLMIGRLLRRLGRDTRWRLRLAVTPDRSRRGLGARRLAVVEQGGGDLAARMRRAIASCPPGPVVLVGADIPALSAGHVAAAFRLLGHHDVVFGPAADGGFWLIGARRSPRLPPLFGLARCPIRWSSPHALADVLANLPHNVSAGFVACLGDVDDADSYRRLAPHRGF